MSTRTLSARKQEQALAIVAAWLGKVHHMTEDGNPTPTGDHAARHALGPMLDPTWDWPSAGPTPTILLEGGPYDWAIEAAWLDDFAKIGVYAEPYAGYALCLYPA